MQFGECQICFNDMAKVVLFGNCDHSFCTSCSVMWIKKSPKCPTCRSLSPFYSVFINSTSKSKPIRLLKTNFQKVSSPHKHSQSTETQVSTLQKDTIHKPLSKLTQIGGLKPHQFSSEELITQFDKETLRFKQESSAIRIRLESQTSLGHLEVDTIGLSHFQENLKILLETCDILNKSLQKYRHYVFYSELDNIVGDVHFHCQLHMDSSKADLAHPENELSAFLETFFSFLNQIEFSLQKKDFKNLDGLLALTDDKYYEGYLPYNFRGYEDEYCQDDCLEDFWEDN